MTKALFKDGNNELATSVLPDGFSCEASCTVETYPHNRWYNVAARATKGNCQINVRNGKTYLLEKIKVQPSFGYAPQPQTPQNESGAYYSPYMELKENLDQIAGQLLNRQVSDGVYYDLSDKMKQKAQQELQHQIQCFVDDYKYMAAASPLPVAVFIRKYLLDGALGIYENGKSYLALCVYRVGIESDVILNYSGISENLSDEPFSKVTPLMNTGISSASWSIPLEYYMESEDKNDLSTFMNFVDNFELTENFRKAAEQNRQQVLEANYQRAQMETMQNQAMWNMAFAQQQQQFAAMDRLSNQLSNDLDQWRSGLNQSMAQFDARINTGSNMGESSDDRIQRMRHESIMGVETYERSNGTTVEFDNRADRVFENNLDSTQHFGTEHYYGDYIPDGWHEMKKK